MLCWIRGFYIIIKNLDQHNININIIRYVDNPRNSTSSYILKLWSKSIQHNLLCWKIWIIYHYKIPDQHNINIIINLELYWYYVELCWIMLTYVEIMLNYVELCRIILNYVELCWNMIWFSEISINRKDLNRPQYLTFMIFRKR